MPTYVMRSGKLIEKHKAAPLPGHYVISDEMPATRHMADGKHYTSKAKFRAATRAAGCIEVGNETATVMKPRKRIGLDRGQRREAIRQAIYELKNGIRR